MWGRGKCPVYATIRVRDHQIRHFKYCDDKAPPVEIQPQLRPWPDTPKADFVVEQTIEDLFANRRFFIRLQDTKPSCAKNLELNPNLPPPRRLLRRPPRRSSMNPFLGARHPETRKQFTLSYRSAYSGEDEHRFRTNVNT